MDKVSKVIWTDDGIKSLEEIAEYIAEDSPYYAANFVKSILNSIERLEIFPGIGRVVPEYNDLKLREIIFQNYRIVYKVDKSIVYIILVFHESKELQMKINNA